MKFQTTLTLVSLLCFFLFSCSNDDVMLYHTKDEPEPPQQTWLLSEVNYESGSNLPNVSLAYDGAGLMNAFTRSSDNLNTIRYFNDSIVISKQSQSGSTITQYDTIHIKLNSSKLIEYAVHTTYSKSTGGDIITALRTNLDSTVFVYNAQKYLQEMDHYKINNKNEYYLDYQQKFNIINGNIVEVENDRDEHFSYTYGKDQHYHESEFCFEMPRSIYSGVGRCWTLGLLPLLSDYLGSKNKNNITAVDIASLSGKPSSNKYANILYDYRFDENNQVDNIVMSGMMGVEPFQNSLIQFSHKEK